MRGDICLIGNLLDSQHKLRRCSLIHRHGCRVFRLGDREVCPLGQDVLDDRVTPDGEADVQPTGEEHGQLGVYPSSHLREKT